MRRVAVLGSTGSIGTQALDVLRLHADRFRVTALAAGSNAALLERQAKEFRPEVALLARPPKGYTPPGIPGVSWLFGEPARAALGNCDAAVNALVGSAGLAVSMEAARLGIRLCLANKETVVVGGALFMEAMRRGGGELIPVDSEHSALFQCMRGGAAPERLILTASGGPFRAWTVEEMRNATPQQALRHPNWAMGERITVDSATMMNKALEVIEAGHLYSMPAEAIDVLVHPSCVIHSFVRFRDGALLAQMGTPDMRVPILYALSCPERLDSGVEAPDLTAAALSFEKPDFVRFPALKMGYDVLRAGGVAGAVLNAADETAVEGFLAGRCGFLDIAQLCKSALEAVPQNTHPTLEELMQADAEARAFVGQELRRLMSS